jgi:hypothetical protein
MLNSFNNFDGSYEEFSFEDFNEVISKFNLKPDFLLSIDGDVILVNEVWSSPKNKNVSANRIYEFDIFFLELIPDEIKKRVLEEVLEIYVEEERYEEAVEVRDSIKLLF